MCVGWGIGWWVVVMVCVRLRELGDRWVDGGNGMCVCARAYSCRPKSK